jgi:hypothetical protein
MPQILAMALVMREFGRHSPWGRFRLAVERFDEVLLELVAQRRRQPRGDSVLDLLLEQRDERGNALSDRHLRDELVALLVGGHDSSAASLAWAFERLAHNPAVHARLREGDPAYLDAVVKEVMRAPGADHRPRLLLAPAHRRTTCRPGFRVRAACGWRCGARTCGRTRRRYRPSAGSTGRLRPAVLDPVRRRRAPCAGAVCRDGDAGGVARGDLRSSGAAQTIPAARRDPHRGAEIIVEDATARPARPAPSGGLRPVSS